MIDHDTLKRMSLQELFPDWKDMETDDVCVVNLQFKRPEYILQLHEKNEISKGISLVLEKADEEYNNHFVLRIQDGGIILSEYYFNDDLTEEIVYDLEGNMVTVKSDEENKDKYLDREDR